MRHLTSLLQVACIPLSPVRMPRAHLEGAHLQGCNRGLQMTRRRHCIRARRNKITTASQNLPAYVCVQSYINTTSGETLRRKRTLSYQAANGVSHGLLGSLLAIQHVVLSWLVFCSRINDEVEAQNTKLACQCGKSRQCQLDGTECGNGANFVFLREASGRG